MDRYEEIREQESKTTLERLTERLQNGVVKRTELHGDSVMLRLAAYEDTGLSPAKVARLTAERDAAWRGGPADEA